MKLRTSKTCFLTRAFTLVEMLAALTVGSMVLIVVLALYNRGQSGTAAVIARMESTRLPREVFQRIAEDLDRVVVPGQGTQIDIRNKFQDGFQVARLEISMGINDAKDQPQTLERIIWQSNVDLDTGLLTLYRSHSGIALEDALLDNQKEPWQRELFVPICSGFTFFRIEIPKDVNEQPLEQWTGETLPPAIRIILSFALPYKTVTGTFDVPEEDKLVRTIAVDRTRRPAFNIPAIDINDVNDINKVSDGNRDANAPADTNLLSTQDLGG
jgi:hypothetical protein